jgi:lipopolysaccharide transport system ATP-binding protein
MRVRLAFAVAAHLEPDILVVDEVLAVGDAEFQKKAIGKMKDISGNDGRTVLFVSHNMAAVKSLCTRGIVLENGTSVFEGTAEESVDYYLEKANKKASISVIDRKDRKGNGKLKVEDIYLVTKEKIRVGEISSGEPCKIVLEYSKKQEIDPKQFTIVIQFKDEQDTIVTTIATDELGKHFEEGEILDNGKIIIDLPRVQFRDGKYSMSFMISEKLAFNNPHKVIDFIDNAYLINVSKGDYWNSGILNRPKGFIQEASIKME